MGITYFLIVKEARNQLVAVEATVVVVAAAAALVAIDASQEVRFYFIDNKYFYYS